MNLENFFGNKFLLSHRNFEDNTSIFDTSVVKSLGPIQVVVHTKYWKYVPNSTDLFIFLNFFKNFYTEKG